MTLPRTAEAVVNLDVFSHHLDFILRAGVRGFVLNGATGEYCLTSPDELGQMLRRAREVTGPGVKLIAAVGAASLTQVLKRVEAAEAEGADALLLPMPHFFPYQQQDLVAFVDLVSRHASLPILLYNLPDFTTPLEPETTAQLLAECPIIKGVKDSGGKLTTMRLLTEQFPEATRVIGNDGALYGALAEQLCDGVVSGVSSVLPELMLAFYRAAELTPLAETTLQLKANLDLFIEWLGKFPVPWGLKIIAAERGLHHTDLPLPMSAQRQDDAVKFLGWFRAHCSELLADSSL